MQLQRKTPQGLAGILQSPKRDEGNIPAICSEQCNTTLLNAQAIGQVPALCATTESSFLTDYGICKACAENNSSEQDSPSGLPSKTPKDNDLPQFKPFLDYCATQIPQATQIPIPTIFTTGPIPPGATAQATSLKNFETATETTTGTPFATILPTSPSPIGTLQATFKVPLPLSSHHPLSPPPPTSPTRETHAWIIGAVAGTAVGALILLSFLFQIQRRQRKLARARARGRRAMDEDPGSLGRNEKGGVYMMPAGKKPQLDGEKLVRHEPATTSLDGVLEMQDRDVGSELQITKPTIFVNVK
ncbi:hypothetical protein HYALB_00000555 [Hymenoscyphus albidus]|uniref:Uncharacterized protein n=1 Tax=Hymenoscyphus albidus TaxID=595503 RepID=A0A9N9M0U1_9HELO|nr:hypothetical protein HYALB_00000555 [Hymenoscyphus albidus]